MKVWQVTLALLISLGLVAGLVLPGLAAPDKPGRPEGWPPLNMLKGTVIGLDGAQEFFVIEVGEDEVTIRVNEETRYFKVLFPARLVEMAKERLGPIMPRLKNVEHDTPPPFAIQKVVKSRLEALKRIRPFGEEASYGDLSIDSMVVVRAVSGESGPLAKVVLIVEPKTRGQVKGVVSAISPQDMTLAVLPGDGSTEIELTYTDKTRFHLIGVTAVEVGQPVKVIYNDDLVARIVIVNPAME